MSTSKITTALVDPYCQYKNATICGPSDKELYLCTLNQTDLKTNKNKFYIMQILKNGNNYVHYIRYGRIGETGVITYKDFSTESSAISAFTKQFRAKTGNSWEDREEFEQIKGKYFLTENAIDDAISKIKKELKTNNDSDDEEPESKLDERVQTLIQTISNTNSINQSMVALEIDTEKMPLGSISKNQLEQAYEILKKIAKRIVKLDDKKTSNKKLNDEIIELSSQFYTLVPYATSKRRAPPTIDNMELVQKFTQTVDELWNIEVTAKIIEQSNDGNQIDNVYDKLQTEIRALDQNEEMWDQIQEYVKNTFAPTHHFKVKVLDIFEINRKGEQDKFEALCKRKKIDNRYLLWHGSRIGNFVGILSTGLRLPASLGNNIIRTGSMFGDGIYFSPCVSKSAQYVYASPGNNIGCMLLAEVAMGNISEKLHSDYYVTEQSLEQQGLNSTWGIGGSGPEDLIPDICKKKKVPGKVKAVLESYEMDNGTKIPNGEFVKRNLTGGSLLYDEMIVYNANQVCLRYLVMLDFAN